MSTDLPRNHLIIQILGEDESPDDPDAMYTAEESSFSSVSGEWTLRLVVSAGMEFLNVACMSITGGVALRDVPENSRLKALDDSMEQARRILEDAEQALRTELINPDNSGIQREVVFEEARIVDNYEGLPGRIPTPEDLQPGGPS